MTFQTMLPSCEAGSAEAWRAFLAIYTPIAMRWLEVHAPQLSSDSRAALWQDAVAALAAEDFQRLRKLDHQGEREFLIDLKSFLLGLAHEKCVPSAPERPAMESLRGLLDGRPIAHQEIILLHLSGYSPASLDRVLVVPGSLVSKALEGISAADDPPPGAWLAPLQEVRAGRTEACPPPRLFARIFDGQISWYDKTPAENHMAGCSHCLDVWASLREADFLRRDTPPAPATEIEPFLAALPLKAAAPPRSFWSKILGR